MTGINSQTVTNAKLCLYNVDGANEGGDIYPVNDDSWQEETVTWNNAPAADTTLLGSLGDVNPDTWYEVNLTSHITADGTYSLRVSDSVGGADYSSKEGTNAPKLLVALGGATPQSCAPAATATPTPGGPTNTPTNTPTPGPSPTPTNTVVPTATPTNPPPAPFNNATFVYDGDGKRVKSIFNGNTTTYFVGNHYEVTGSTIIKYYYAGSQRIAMRTNGTLLYILGDHLGSTSLTTDANGQNPTKTYYKAWGEVRYASGAAPTKYTYTGQYSDSYINLLWYGSRHYDPELGRFIQPDSIVPLASQGVQAWDRYAYVNNNPVRYTDPTGHCIGVITCTLTLFGVLPDYFGAMRAMVFTKADDAVVAAGIAVQSEWLGPQDIPIVMDAYDSIYTGITGNQPSSHHYGWAQTSEEEGNPFDPSVAAQAMEARINDAIDACIQCETGADKLIVAALAQNGFDFNQRTLGKLPEVDGHIDWNTFLSENGDNPGDSLSRLRQSITRRNYDTQFMLKLFLQDLRLLRKLGYDLPDWASEQDVKEAEGYLE